MNFLITKKPICVKNVILATHAQQKLYNKHNVLQVRMRWHKNRSVPTATWVNTLINLAKKNVYHAQKVNIKMVEVNPIAYHAQWIRMEINKDIPLPRNVHVVKQIPAHLVK